jgi:hypothetical protein
LIYFSPFADISAEDVCRLRHLSPERTRSMPLDNPDRQAGSLAPLERTVVAMALRDPLWSVPGTRRWLGPEDRRGRRLYLANPRLEALRRFVVLRSHGRDGRDETLLTAGFSPGQIHEALMLARLHPGV